MIPPVWIAYTPKGCVSHHDPRRALALAAHMADLPMLPAARRSPESVWWDAGPIELKRHVEDDEARGYLVYALERPRTPAAKARRRERDRQRAREQKNSKNNGDA